MRALVLTSILLSVSSWAQLGQVASTGVASAVRTASEAAGQIQAQALAEEYCTATHNGPGRIADQTLASRPGGVVEADEGR